MREIPTQTVERKVRRYSGTEAILVKDAVTGKVTTFKTGNQLQTHMCQEHHTMLVGTDEEIIAAKAEADEQYAPIKAQLIADREAARAARRASK